MAKKHEPEAMPAAEQATPATAEGGIPVGEVSPSKDVEIAALQALVAELRVKLSGEALKAEPVPPGMKRYKCSIEHGQQLLIDEVDPLRAEKKYLKRMNVIATPHRVTVEEAPLEKG